MSKHAWNSEEMRKQIIHIRQSVGNRLAGTAMRGQAQQKVVKFPIAGTGEAYEITGAIQDVKPMNPRLDTVSVAMRDYEATIYVNKQDIQLVNPVLMEKASFQLATAIGRQADRIQWDANKAFANAPGVVTAGSATQVTDLKWFGGNKAKLLGPGDNGDFDIFCPIPVMQMEQLNQDPKFANSDWVGDRDLPMLKMKQVLVRHHNGIIYFTMPDSYFEGPNGAKLGSATEPDSFYTYMWCSDSVGVESVWDEKAPKFNQIDHLEGAPYLGRVGMGGAAVGVLPKGFRRLHLKTMAESDLHNVAA